MSSFLIRVIVCVLSLIALASLAVDGHCFAFEDLYIVSVPNSEVLPHGNYRMSGALGPESSILASVAIGFFDRISIGTSFGFQGLIGRGDMSVNDRIGLSFRLLLLEEASMPLSMTFGIETQGDGRFLESDERYERKSPGVFISIGRTYQGSISLSGGMNYSLEDRDESSPDFFAGAEIKLVEGLEVLMDYDAALDDDSKDVATCRTRGRGYLDLGIGIGYRDNIKFKILFKDVLGNYLPQSGVQRALEIVYMSAF